MTADEAFEQIVEPLKWGAMMVRLNEDADAMVAGAENSTGNVLLAAFQIIKTAPGTKFASSCFVMKMNDPKWGVDGHMIFSDCATIPNPTTEQLAEITVAAAQSCRTFLKVEPEVAMLSFSTKGSAKDDSVDKVLEALALVQERAPELHVDGELQLDAAVVESVGSKKAPGSHRCRSRQHADFPRPERGKYRVQTGSALCRCRRLRSISAGICQTGQRPVPRVLG